ncbi:hypothetical protein [Ekhidna sp. To15]|uniref:hypothetical protein n=1 Tax=Ekhidna sp. To15 TaxID=3395267 RepID=UPI003F526FA1
MSKKETIEDRVKSLEAREKKIKLQIDSDSDEMKDRAKRIGKIALVTGVVTILGYWIFNIIFQDDDEEKPKKKKKKRNSESKGFGQRIGALAMPYLNSILDGILNEDENTEVKTKKESKEEKTD